MPKRWKPSIPWREASPHSIDLVITDLNMPKMTGDQLSKELIATKADIPVIMCSGLAESIEQRLPKGFGIKEFLPKPVTATELSRVVRKVLDGSHA